MKYLKSFTRLLCVVSLLSTTFVYAHGNLSKRIKQKTVEISKDPKNPTLYFERGFLYEQHHEFNHAIKDYLKSEKLGYSKVVLQYRKAQTYFYQKEFDKALEATNMYMLKNAKDVKIQKLHAQILIKQHAYPKALKHYSYFINNAIDLTPDDMIEYSQIYLAIDPFNYSKALEVINNGLQKIGEDTFSLQLKKLEYLEDLDQVNKVITQYNYFIKSTKRKEFWYYKKAEYLSNKKLDEDAVLALEQAKITIALLDSKFKNTDATQSLEHKIINLEKKISDEN